MKNKVSFFASLGSAIEYFDFVIYALLATQIGNIFFPSLDTAYLKTFLVFAVGYLARPIGGILMGTIGDLFGRKKGFSLSILLMAISTTAIAFLPGYQSWGIGGPLLLITCRFVQGLSFGAELPGAITFIAENEKPMNRSGKCSYAISSATIGSILASLLLYTLSQSLGEKSMQHFGWRIPFLIGGMGAFITFYGRRSIPSQKVNEKKVTIPLLQLCKEYLPALILGSIAMFFPASLVICNLYLPRLLSSFSFDFSNIFLAMTIGLVWSTITVPLFGILADRVGKRYLFSITAVILATIGAPLLSFLLSFNLILFAIVYQTFISAAQSSFFPFLTELFPRSVRYTGVALCYNLAFVAAAFMPAFLEKCLTRFPTVLSFFLVLSFVALLSLIAALFTIVWQKKKALRIEPNN